MAEVREINLMQDLVVRLKKDIDEQFKEYAEVLIAEKTKEINDILEKKKAEMIVNVVRNVSSKYNLRSLGDTITIEIIETKNGTK